jgi:hypothetical protein
MTGSVVVKSQFRIVRRRKGRKQIVPGDTPPKPRDGVPRIARLMALAIRFDRLVRDGTVLDFAELARLGHVTRARLSQIMNLINLAPDIQEEILFLTRQRGRQRVTERTMRPIAAEVDWRRQREMWVELQHGAVPSPLTRPSEAGTALDQCSPATAASTS